MVTDRDTVFATLQRQRDRVRALGVRSLGLFGSVADDAGGPTSDLDFLVDFERISFDAYMDLKFLLEDTFGCQVDLVPIDGIKPRLREAILRQVRYARDFKTYLEDMLAAAERIPAYVVGMDLAAFLADDKTRDAVIRNLEVLGEAAKNVPEDIRLSHPQIEWRKISGLRDILIHGYFEINDTVIWEVVTTKLGPLAVALRAILGR